MVSSEKNTNRRDPICLSRCSARNKKSPFLVNCFICIQRTCTARNSTSSDRAVNITEHWCTGASVTLQVPQTYCKVANYPSAGDIQQTPTTPETIHNQKH